MAELDAPNVAILDVSQILVGHRLCEDTVDLVEDGNDVEYWTDANAADDSEWVAQIRGIFSQGGLLELPGSVYDKDESFHPSYWGQLALRNCLRQAYNNGNIRGGTCTFMQDGLNDRGEPQVILAPAGRGKYDVTGHLAPRPSMRGPPRGSPTAAAWEVAPGVFCLGPKGRTQTNVYFVRSEAGWVLIDAGWERDGPRIEQAAAELTEDGSRPLAILLTHCHPDHSGAALALARAWDCPVWMHPAELPIAQGDFEAMRTVAGPLDRWVILPVMQLMGRRRREALLARSRLGDVARAFEPGGEVPGLPGWQCIPTPGHTPGHVAYFRVADRVAHLRRCPGDAARQLACRPRRPAGVLRATLVHDLGSASGARFGQAAGRAGADRRGRRPRLAEEGRAGGGGAARARRPDRRYGIEALKIFLEATDRYAASADPSSGMISRQSGWYTGVVL